MPSEAWDQHNYLTKDDKGNPVSWCYECKHYKCECDSIMDRRQERRR